VGTEFSCEEAESGCELTTHAMAKLILHLPDGSMRDIPLEPGRTTIGRRADNDIHLGFPAVSAEHAAVVTVQSDSFLHDLGSTNGTLVNGNRVTKHFLRDHDKIDIGRQHLVYVMNEAETIDALPPDALSQEMRSLEERVDDLVRSEAPKPLPPPIPEPADVAPDRPRTLADELLADLMETQDEASAVAVASVADAVIKVLTGPNAGQATPMTRPEFVLGRRGAQIAAIRRGDSGYRLVPLADEHRPTVNGSAVEREGVELAFGDTLDVAGVKLRFERAA